MEGIQQQNLDISNKWVINNNPPLTKDNVEKYPRMIRYDRDQIETRQHHDHEITQFLSKLWWFPKADYHQCVWKHPRESKDYVDNAQEY